MDFSNDTALIACISNSARLRTCTRVCSIVLPSVWASLSFSKENPSATDHVSRSDRVSRSVVPWFHNEVNDELLVFTLRSNRVIKV